MSIIRKRGRIIKRNNSSILSVNNASSLQKNLRRCNHPLKSLQHSKAIKKYLGTGLHSIDAIWWRSLRPNKAWNFTQLTAVNSRVTDGSCPRRAETGHPVESSHTIWICTMAPQESEWTKSGPQISVKSTSSRRSRRNLNNKMSSQKQHPDKQQHLTKKSHLISKNAKWNWSSETRHIGSRYMIVTAEWAVGLARTPNIHLYEIAGSSDNSSNAPNHPSLKRPKRRYWWAVVVSSSSSLQDSETTVIVIGSNRQRYCWLKKTAMKKKLLLMLWGYKTPRKAKMIIATTLRRMIEENARTTPKKRKNMAKNSGSGGATTMRTKRNGEKMTIKMMVKITLLMIRSIAVMTKKRTKKQRTWDNIVLITIDSSIAIIVSKSMMPMSASNSTPQSQLNTTINQIPHPPPDTTTCRRRKDQQRPIKDPARKAVSLAITLSPRPASTPNGPTKRSKSRGGGSTMPNSRRRHGGEKKDAGEEEEQ